MIRNSERRLVRSSDRPNHARTFCKSVSQTILTLRGRKDKREKKREREGRGRERERQTDRQTERERVGRTDGHTHTQGEGRETDRQTQTDRSTDRYDRVKDSQRAEREREAER